MKNRILLIVAFFTIGIGSVCAQDISVDLLGKWKLQSMSIDGKTGTAKDGMGTSEVYQVYELKSKFTGIVGSDSNKGKWKLSKDKTEINIKAGGSKTVFKVVSFEKNKMTLSLDNGGKEILLNYTKE